MLNPLFSHYQPAVGTLELIPLQFSWYSNAFFKESFSGVNFYDSCLIATGTASRKNVALYADSTCMEKIQLIIIYM